MESGSQGERGADEGERERETGGKVSGEGEIRAWKKKGRDGEKGGRGGKGG